MTTNPLKKHRESIMMSKAELARKAGYFSPLVSILDFYFVVWFYALKSN